MANDSGVKMRFRPTGSRRKRSGSAVYGPLDTGCPAVEQAVSALYRAQNEESFWTLMNALNYALELDTRVLIPLQASPDPQAKPVPWAEHPVPAEKAKDLPLWLLRTNKGKSYLPLFVSLEAAEAERSTAVCPMTEMLMLDAMTRALDTDGIDGIVINPWTDSATLDVSLLNGLLRASRDNDEPGEAELTAGRKAAQEDNWAEAAKCFEEAATQGRAEGLALLGELLYTGRGVRKSVTQARRLWKKAAEAGDVLALVALGDDCQNSGKDRGAALLYYRKAQSAAARTPDISYTPQIRLRIAQCETKFVSKAAAIAQLAEARQGFQIRLREGDTDAKPWLDETEAELQSLVEPQKT